MYNLPQPIERRLPLFATFLSFVFSGGLLMGFNGYLPPPRPDRAKVAQTPGRARVIIQHVRIFRRISEPTHRHERTDWRLGMDDWHEKAWTVGCIVEIFLIFICIHCMKLLVPDMYWVKKCHPKKSEPKTHPAPSKTILTRISDARRWSLPASYARTNTTWWR